VPIRQQWPALVRYSSPSQNASTIATIKTVPCPSTTENTLIASRNNAKQTVFLSIAMRIVASRVLTKLNVSTQAEQTAVKRGLGV
jgi:hypothetical protein